MKMISGASWGANIKTLRRLYVQYIRPLFEHGSAILAEISNIHTQKMEITERAALRVILRPLPRTKNEILCSLTDIKPLKQRLKILRDRAMERFSKYNFDNDLSVFKNSMI